MDTEKILEGLSQEERLELLERLIQGAERAYEESLGSEERLERLESLVGVPGVGAGAGAVTAGLGRPDGPAAPVAAGRDDGRRSTADRRNDYGHMQRSAVRCYSC